MPFHPRKVGTNNRRAVRSGDEEPLTIVHRVRIGMRQGAFVVETTAPPPPVGTGMLDAFNHVVGGLIRGQFVSLDTTELLAISYGAK